MGFRFRRSISILPGLKLNISKSGISTSIGGRGVTINFSKRGTRTTVGLPGTGISYSSLSYADARGEQGGSSPGNGTEKGGGGCALVLIAVLAISVLGALFSASFKQASRPAPRTPPIVERLVVTASALNCRSGPAVSERRMARLSHGQEVTVAAPIRQGGWVKLEIGGTQCWALEQHLSRIS